MCAKMSPMHRTTEEVALASVAVGGLIGAFGGSLRDRSNERRDHMVRLWEQETRIYEELLVQVDDWRVMRNRLREQFQGLSDFRLRPGDLDFLGDKSYQRIDVQLRMFARPEVMAAWDKIGALLRECVIHMAKFNAASHSKETGADDERLARLVQIKDDIQRVPTARQLPRPVRLRKARAPGPAQPG